MMIIKNKPYHLLLITVILLGLVSLFYQKTMMDIHLHDTYFVISKSVIYQLIGVSVLLLWGLYLLSVKILYSKKLTWLHTITTMLTVLVVIIMLNIDSFSSHEMPRRYYDYSSWESSAMFDNTILYLTKTALFLLLGQLFYIINLIAGIVKYFQRK